MSPAIRRRLLQILFLVLLQAVTLFISVGKWFWWNAWVYLGIYLLFLMFNVVVLLPHNKELVEERSQTGAGTKRWDRIIGGIGAFGGFLILILAGLDERYNWPGVIGFGAQIGAFILMGLSYPIFTWAMVSNKYFATTVRIQKERGHTVQTGGPYRYIRHPGYASLLITYITIPIALGSWWACIPTALLVVNLFIRTYLEDRTLKDELAGYVEYSTRVRYRLLPWIW